MPPRRAPSTDRLAENVEDLHVNAPSPPNGDVATRALEGMARFFEQQFQDDASLWWEGAEHGINLATLTWARFKEMFYEKHFTADVRGRLKREFMTLRHGETSAAEFVRNFYRGCHFVPLNARDAAEKFRHFLDGLRPTIRRDVMMMRSLDYAAATAYAFQVDQALKDINFEVQRKRQQHQQHSQPNNKPYVGPPRPQGQQKPQGQVKKPRTPKPQQPGAPKLAKRCFICKEEGHKAADCQKKNSPTVGRAYVMHVEEAEEEQDMTLLPGGYYSRCSYLYTARFGISETFVKQLNIIPEHIGLSFKVSIPSGGQMITSNIVKNLELRLYKDVVQADLIVLPMPEFDIILGME
ncbi:uncharacterized protein LOC142509307 [Primulina tabacum]|uniref:uncharacterized protein LOC142509307 n=1 Tax=Primulina tabacum TaxID=48773 RepID=UPI003F5AA57F